MACVLAAVWTGAAIPWLRPQVTIAGIVVIAARRRAALVGHRHPRAVLHLRGGGALHASRSCRSGPYRFVRHPSYTAILIMLLGVGVALANWASLVVMLAGGLLGLLYRVRVEERALVEALGQPYRDYMRHTKRFIPFMY